MAKLDNGVFTGESICLTCEILSQKLRDAVLHWLVLECV